MAQDAEKVLGELKSGKFAPLYFLQGDESFFIDQISDYVEDHALEESQKGFNQVILYGKDTDVNTVITNAKRFPMMSERQVVIIKEAQEIKDLNREAGQKLLSDYADNPMPSTILVFAHKNKTLDGRKGLAKVLDKKAVLVNSKKMYDNQVPAWIERFFQQKQRKIQPKAVALLAESVGNNLSRLANECNKMLVNLKDDEEVSPDHVSKYVGISKEYNVFELQKALAQKDVLKANKIILYFAQDPKSNPIIPIIALLYGYFTKVLMVHQSKDKSKGAIASLLKVNPFFAMDYINAAQKYSISACFYVIQTLAEADRKSKGIGSGSEKEDQQLKELIFRIIHA